MHSIITFSTDIFFKLFIELSVLIRKYYIVVVVTTSCLISVNKYKGKLIYRHLRDLSKVIFQ